MTHPDVTFIANLDVLKDDSTIKVKVINLWNLFSFYNNAELFSIELILIDEQVSIKLTLYIIYTLKYNMI